MKLVVALDAKYKCLAFSCDHKPLPCLRTFLYVRQFLDVMDFKVSSLFLTVFTFVGVLPSQEFASIRLCASPLRIILPARESSRMPPLHYRVREPCHDATPLLLSADGPGTPVVLSHAVLP